VRDEIRTLLERRRTWRDQEMVRLPSRHGLLDPGGVRPSIETLLHASSTRTPSSTPTPRHRVAHEQRSAREVLAAVYGKDVIALDYRGRVSRSRGWTDLRSEPLPFTRSTGI